MLRVLGSMHCDVEWNEAEGNSLADGNPYIGPDAILSGVFSRLVGNHEYFNLKDIQHHNMSDHKVLATLRYEAKVIETGKAIMRKQHICGHSMPMVKLLPFNST